MQDTAYFPWGDFHLNLLPPLHVVRCRQCGLLFLSPRPSASARQAMMQGRIPESLHIYSRQPANYSAVTHTRSQLFQDRLTTLEAKVTKNVKSVPLKLLDIGASSGTLVQLARERGWDAQGIEPSLDGTRSALKNGIYIAQGLAESLPLPDRIFDVVHAHHVFEHLVDPLAATRESWRVLKHDGLLFIEVPNQFENVSFRRDMLLRRVSQRERNVRSIHHLWFFSRRTIRLLLHQAGFTNIAVEDGYGAKAKGLRSPISSAMRFAGQFMYGGPLLRAWGFKPGRE